MKPNNLLYRQIAIETVGDEFPKFYSSMYYMRAIAEEYKGQPYTGRKPSNKYLKDWYMLLTGQSEPQTHKYNLWYLRRIAKYTDPTIDEDTLNENQCLQVIADNEPVPPTPTPTPSSIDLTGTKDILSYADGESSVLTATVYDENDDPMSGQTVAIKIYDKDDDSLIETLTVTDEGDGTYTSTYASQGIGDVYAKAECRSLVTETYSVQDYLFVPTLDSNRQFYQMAGTTTISNNEMSGGSAKLLPAFDNSGNWECTFKAKFSGNNCCALLIPSNETSRDTNELLVTAYWNSINYYNNGAMTENRGSATLIYGNWYTVKITKNGSSVTAHIQDKTITTSNWNSVSASNLQIGIGSWSTSGNVCTIKDIVIKPL